MPRRRIRKQCQGMSACARQATAQQICVSNIPSQGTGNALACAEMAIYLMLGCLRAAHAMAASIRARRVGAPLGRTLFGASVLIVGYGGIARELVPRCALHAAAAVCCWCIAQVHLFRLAGYPLWGLLMLRKLEACGLF